MVASTCPECRGALDICPHGDGRGLSPWPRVWSFVVLAGVFALLWAVLP